MEIRLLNSKFTPVAVIDIYTSFIWTDRYYEAGDFELKLPLAYLPAKMAVGLYITYDRSDRAMVIESMQIDRTSDDENIVTVTGRSLEVLLDRRVIYEYVYVKDTLIEDYIKILLDNAVISPKNDYRKIDTFIFSASGDADISAIKVEAQHQGESLYDVLCEMCKKNHIGWRLRLIDGKLTFSLFNGRDKSAVVIFSEAMNNIAECQFLQSVKDYRNAALIVGGEDADVGKVYLDVDSDDSGGKAVGINRRELAVKSYAKYKTADSAGKSVTLTSEQYAAVLRNEGKEKLTEHRVTGTVNGKTDSTDGQFQYGVNFTLGDIVTLDTGLSSGVPSRVTEATFSTGVDGFEQYQSFESVDDSEEVDI